MSVALLPGYENVGSALKDESNHMQDSFLCNSLESLSLLEERNKDCCFVQTVLRDCTTAELSGGKMLLLCKRCRQQN